VAIGTDHPEFDVAQFQARLMIAKWLAEYDRFAWKTTDLLIARIKKEGAAGMGAEWFIYPAGNKMIAVYGQYDKEADRYAPKHAFAENSGQITFVSPEDTQPPIELARAAHQLAAKAQRIAKDGLRVNYYLRQDPGGPILGYILPAGLEKNTSVYCKGWCFEFSRDGRKLVADQTVLPQKIQKFECSREVSAAIDEDTDSNPSAGALFFLLRDSAAYKFLAVQNQDYRTVLFAAGGVDGFIRFRTQTSVAPSGK
jgi:hypothetical protein